MTPKHHAAHDAQVAATAELYALADTLHRRALGLNTAAIRHASAGEWDEAEKAMNDARATQATADALTAEADAS